MFDNVITKITKPKSVDWKAPNKMVLELNNSDEKPITYELLKGAETYLNDKIDIKSATSKELFKKADDLWRQLRDRQLDKCLDEVRPEDQFSLTKDTVVYLTTTYGDIVDIQDLKTEQLLSDFEDLHQKFVIDLTTTTTTRQFCQDGKGGLVKFMFYDKDTDFENDEYIPIIIAEINHKKSEYKVYTGILVYKPFTIIPSLSVDLSTKRFYDFIYRFNMQEQLEHSKEKAPELYEAYKKFKQTPVEISVRELTTILKKVGYEIELENDDKISPIKNFIDDINNKKVQDFYNNFKFVTGENCLDILKLSDFRKTFRYNELTILELLEILSSEYARNDDTKITAEILGDVVYKLYDTSSADKSQVKTIEKELE